MKKIAAFFIAVLSALTLFSCSDKIDKIGKEIKEQQIENMDNATANFKRGIINNRVYTSEFGNIKFSSPESWVFATDEEMLAMMNVTIDDGADGITGDAELTKKLLEKTTIYDMQISDPSTGDNIIVMYENIPAYGVDPDDYTVSKYLKQADSLLTSGNGITYSGFTDEKTVTLAGNEFTRVSNTATYDDYNFSITQTYYVRKVDDFMMGIIITSASEDTSKYEKYFEKLS